MRSLGRDGWLLCRWPLEESIHAESDADDSSSLGAYRMCSGSQQWWKGVGGEEVGTRYNGPISNGRRKRLRQKGVWIPVVQYCISSGSDTVSAAPFTPSRAEVFHVDDVRASRPHGL